ncbi:hypothetical protein KDN32_06885 [Nocardioides sp. J2M5]|uniref:hypothetical protein n=1 Tax=Nocardioides palaemonis TaxID=2829810 RepID=UPI001BA4B07E|nr:hypothetical protein [Nocardioides palaemonis]MBS2937463.1 hypothetical protein [Nocardioides palaemonis]
MSDDDRLLADLRRMWQVADPPPPGLGAAMVATVAAADLDEEWELLVLVRDSAGEDLAAVRGLGTARMLSFSAAAGWSLEAEIDGEQFSGQVLDLGDDQDPTDVVVAVETRAGESWSTPLDEFGFFSLVAHARGTLRFTVRFGGVVASSHWVEV